MRHAIFGLAFVLFGCAGAAPEPSSAGVVEPATKPSKHAAASPSPASKSGSAPAAQPTEAPKPPPRMSIHLLNSCGKIVRLLIERRGSSTETSLNYSTGTDERIEDGDSIAITDENHKVLDKQTVEPGMRELEIVSGCAKLERH